MILRLCFAACASVLPLLAASAAPAAAQAGPQPVAAPAKAIDPAGRQAVVEKLAQSMRDQYVFPEIGEQAAAALTAALARGDYNALSDPAALAARLTADLAAVAHDKHLRVISQASPPPPPPAGARPAPRDEAGIVRADKLANDIGYIEVSGFPPPPVFKPVLDRALAKLKGSRALIIDDRRNGGGVPQSVAYLVSYLLPPGEPVTIIEFIGRTPGTREFKRDRTITSPTPFSFGGVPIYVLTSKATFSGGEEFAYDLKTMKRATLVGEVTGGGANPVGPVSLGYDLLVAMPGGRPESPITKTNWEGVGVEPDVRVPEAEALGAALKALGEEPVADINAASREQLFTPRSTPVPGSDAVLRRVIAMYATGKMDDTLFAPDAIEEARRALPFMLAQRMRYGELKSLTFREVRMGADMYVATFDNGAAGIGIAVDPDGRVLATTGFMPHPPGK
ncbi:S41 family peptidase [Sphingomonas quercus]|uniref:S41 family peptidase n=1 Tax=Sphingomonas quercus TaxID=2842451 RepID=A0ABS6BKG0_9SPHN|nr:S41 family peptidase [Sphingomonas quercus]MBU3078781.1 S41 family peptidase [Sphingomonas quercus]